MKFSSVQKKMKRTPEETARIKALREKLQQEKPGPEDCEALMPLGAFVNLQILLHDLKEKRKSAGLTLKEIATRAGMDTAALSRLENGLQVNPTTETLQRYAGAIGKQVVFSVIDLPYAKPRTGKKVRKNQKEKTA